jgi:hypothetical protein
MTSSVVASNVSEFAGLEIDDPLHFPPRADCLTSGGDVQHDPHDLSVKG